MAKTENDKPRPTPEIVNRKARFNYEILDTWEAGMVLQGHEVKSLRGGGMNIAEAYVRPGNGEVWLLGAHITPYSNRGYAVADPIRPRKLLLNAAEIKKILGAVTEKGLTIVPLKVYFHKGRAKILIGLGRGKDKGDKRQTIKTREQNRETARDFRAHKIKI